MQLPPLERSPNLRPAGNEAVSAVARVMPVAPVNPPDQVSITPVEPTPSVINLVNQAHKPSTGEGVYTSVSDPGRPGSEAATSRKDWTIHRPVVEKVEDPPPVPMSQVLMDHIKSLWTASASAVQVQQQVKNQLDSSQPNLNATPGTLSSEVFTYSPSKINKTEQI
ncbi:MAG: hypothetical protein KJ614_03010 [Gammaproteobacteria bacterium]|uniref:hypothetical protein n=1 Tax=Rhodoferax sp. TaxID=50421 RepID=UPI0017AC8BB1|nr:hypothetical protein [Rhodoferax sp.]MBU3897886.1 hypothetical protein [Gammaproteobacteria bacterium]MBA3057767.1 hypothetical protein [Rhodoferax sp.]MBU3998878.1 hypothetical protein [Gammaproteobacteria bacterium]MBU4019457.1 hypothetical protein [Gammaproteobacteria bacterium]MBU4080779.1 hypothetical protein [Gammaproteobacteria bacterium]